MDSAFNNILFFKWLQWNGMAQCVWHSVFKSMPQFIQEPLLHYVPNWVSSVQLLSIQRLRNWVSSPERCQPRVIRRVSKREGWKNTQVLNLPPSCAYTAMSGHILILNITVEKVFWHPCRKNKKPSVFLNIKSRAAHHFSACKTVHYWTGHKLCYFLHLTKNYSLVERWFEEPTIT